MNLKGRNSIKELHLSQRAKFKNGLIEQEKDVAIKDFMNAHFFDCHCLNPPFNVRLDLNSSYVVLKIEDAENHLYLNIPLKSFTKIIKDYFKICEAYYTALQQLTHDQIQAIDMGRRSLHNEGAALLQALLAPQITIDFDTSRRLFTLLCVILIGHQWV